MLVTTNVIFCGFNALSHSFVLECSKDYVNLTSTCKIFLAAANLVKKNCSEKPRQEVWEQAKLVT